MNEIAAKATQKRMASQSSRFAECSFSQIHILVGRTVALFHKAVPAKVAISQPLQWLSLVMHLVKSRVFVRLCAGNVPDTVL